MGCRSGTGAVRSLSLFSLFFPEIYSERGIVARRILGRGRFARAKNSKTAAVPPLFFAAFTGKNSDNRGNNHTSKTRRRDLNFKK